MGEKLRIDHQRRRKDRDGRSENLLVQVTLQAAAPFRVGSGDGEPGEELGDGTRRGRPLHLPQCVHQVLCRYTPPIHPRPCSPTPRRNSLRRNTSPNSPRRAPENRRRGRKPRRPARPSPISSWGRAEMPLQGRGTTIYSPNKRSEKTRTLALPLFFLNKYNYEGVI